MPVSLSDTDSWRLVHTDTVTQYPVWVYNHELKVSIRRTGLRQRVDRRILVQVHPALFPNVRLLAVSERSIRSATLTVAVTHSYTIVA